METPNGKLRDETATSAPAIKLVHSVLSRAIEEEASDIHFEPGPKELTVRARIDGVTRELTRSRSRSRPPSRAA
jgi:type II secretory ATPase GspE/PulE/Tfp pilus assembly ATPase PilB-like protein